MVASAAPFFPHKIRSHPAGVLCPPVIAKNAMTGGHRVSYLEGALPGVSDDHRHRGIRLHYYRRGSHRHRRPGSFGKVRCAAGPR